MNKFLKKLSVFLMVTTMAFAAVGCGNKETAADDTTTVAETPVADDAAAETPAVEEAPATEEPAADAAALSDEDYKAKVEEIYNGITATSTELMAAVDQTDVEATMEAMTTLVTTVKPMYEELAGLVAPETYAEAQAQIKSGADASVELLNLTLEMLALGDGASDADAEAKVAELQEKMTSFTTSAQDLTTGITTVLGGAE